MEMSPGVYLKYRQKKFTKLACFDCTIIASFANSLCDRNCLVLLRQHVSVVPV